MPVRDIERELEKLVALRVEASGDTRTRALRKALNDKVNVIVAKAAALAAEMQLRDVTPELCAAFDRLLIEPLKSDPKCWGKEAIAKALKDLEYAESNIFQKGIHHVQLEPVWGGEEDTAANLRAICALALLPCTDLTREDKLWLVMPLLTDRSPSLRKDAITALESLDGREAALLLRIKARMGDREADVTGQALESLLRIERDSAVSFVTEFLRSPDPEVREEAALALGASRLTAAVTALESAFTNAHMLLDHELLCRALSISRNEEALHFLLNMVRKHRASEAISALEALKLYRESGEVCAKIREAGSHRTEPDIQRTLDRLFAAS